MITGQITKTYAAKSGVDLSAKEGYAAKYDAGANLAIDKLLSGAEVPLGIVAIRGGNTSTLPVTVVLSGPTNAIAGAAVAAGALVTCDGSGKMVTAAAGNHVYGKALEAASGDGKTFLMLVNIFAYTADT